MNLIDILGTDPDVVSRMVEVSFEYQNLLEKIKILNKREKKVLELRFGLINGIKKTQREISKMLGISRSYVSRIEKKAIEKLVKSMDA
ncbi:sigma-70 family RNA polymerase sigma factor [Desulfonispora thiosulfatigenes]